MSVDLRLYALVDPDRSGGHELGELSRKLVQGGATLVQLRDKTGPTLRMIEEARAIKAALAGSFVPLLINDRVDVALAAGADGVHVGWDDMPVADARRLLGREAIIGLSIKTRVQIERAPLELLDYVCIGGVFETSSRTTRSRRCGRRGSPNSQRRCAPARRICRSARSPASTRAMRPMWSRPVRTASR
jgi:thiamine-phosphate pyrophosphorylase